MVVATVALGLVIGLVIGGLGGGGGALTVPALVYLLGLTAQVVPPLGKGDGILLIEDRRTYRVEPVCRPDLNGSRADRERGSDG